MLRTRSLVQPRRETQLDLPGRLGGILSFQPLPHEIDARLEHVERGENPLAQQLIRHEPSIAAEVRAWSGLEPVLETAAGWIQQSNLDIFDQPRRASPPPCRG